jgi:tetratricopeptide (TPR) repeat protein
MSIKRKLVYSVLGFLSLLLVIDAHAQETTAGMEYTAEEAGIDAMYYDAVKAFILDKNNDAENLLLEFLKAKPDVAAAYYELARVSSKLNKPDKAEVYIKKALELDSNNKWYWEVYAGLLADRSDYFGAANIQDKLSQKNTRNRDYLLTASILYQRAGKDTLALKELNKALAAGPDEEVLMRKQQIFSRQNNVDSIAAVMNQLINLDPKEGKYYALLAEIYDNNHLFDKAMQLYERGLHAVPGDITLQFGLAEHYRKSGDMVKYNDYIKKAIVNNNIDAETQLELLRTYLSVLKTDSERAIQGLPLMKQIVEQHANDAELHAVFGDLYILNNDPEHAMEQYKLSVAIDPSKFLVWDRILRGYSEKKDADSLILYAHKVLRLFPNQAEAHYLYGIGLMNKKNYSEAINAISRAIDLQPEEDTATLSGMYAILGDIYNTTKQYDLSDSAEEKALRLQPDNAVVLNNYAYYLSVRGDRMDEAEKMSKRSLELQPGMATYMDTYGWIMYKQHKYEKAKEYIEKAIAADPNIDGTVWGHLGDITFKLGNVDKAVEYWEKAKEKNTEDPLIDKKIHDRKLYE